MLRELKFVQGAVAKKDLLPALTNFRIEGGHVRSFNGKLALSSPIAFNIDCNPKAEQLLRAIAQCDDVIVLSMTSGGRLRVQSGRFRAFVETLEGETAHPLPEGEEVHFDGDHMLAACKLLMEFVGEDASKPWTNGVLFMGHSAFATNNVIIIEYWLGSPFPEVINVPRDCIREIVRINEPPTHAQISGNSITFHYTDGRWIRSQLLNTDWPFEMITKLLSGPSNPKPVPDELFEGIEVLKRMADGSSRIYLSNGLLRTHTEENTGGSYEVDGIEFDGVYNLAMLAKLKGVVTTADFTLYPAPCLFFGERIRGAVIGMRS